MSDTGLLFKKYNSFSKQELVYVFITSILAGFYLSFDDWGLETYDAMAGIENFLAATFSVLLILSLVILAQKALGSFFGYVITYEYAWVGLILGFFVTVISYGAFPLFLPGGINYKIIKSARIGMFFPSYKHSEMFVISSMAVIIPLFFTLVFGSFFIGTSVEIFRHITITALLFALFALIPAPHVRPIHKWKIHGVSEIRFIKHLSGGTYGYDLFSFHHTAYMLIGITTLVCAGHVTSSAIENV